jgi:hypothetical protein
MKMLEIADVVRQFGPSYLDAFGARMLPSHRRALEDIAACRTPAMGGHLYQCDGCGESFYVYHGCRNRSCPACHTGQTAQWLEARTEELLPCPYYHVCVTVPSELHPLFRSNQSLVYGLLMKAAAGAVRELCGDKRYMGATPAILAVLHTWTVRMDYHPHVHLLVSGGGIAGDDTAWREAKRNFLVPVRALSRLVCGKFYALLQKEQPGLAAEHAGAVWEKKWVAWCKPWGRGEQAVLDYLARYVHRIAITNSRILAIGENTVTFRYKNRKQNRWRTCTLSGHEFLRRFLQHVLPKGLHKVRYYGLWNPRKRQLLRNARVALELARDPAPGGRPADRGGDESSLPPAADAAIEPDAGPACPRCGCANTRHLDILPRGRNALAPRASPAAA